MNFIVMHNATAGGQPPTGLSDPSCTCGGRMCECLAEAAMRIQTEKLDELLGRGAPRSRRGRAEIARREGRGRRARAATSPPPRVDRAGRAEFRLANYYIDYNSKMWFMDTGNDRDMLKLQNDPNVKTRYGMVNIAIAAGIGAGVAGRTWMDQIVNKDSTPIAIFGPDADMSTILHEMGHVMGLPHTAGKPPVTTRPPPPLLLLSIWRLIPLACPRGAAALLLCRPRGDVSARYVSQVTCDRHLGVNYGPEKYCHLYTECGLDLDFTNIPAPSCQAPPLCPVTSAHARGPPS